MFFVHHLESLGVSEFSLRQSLRLKQGWLESLGPEGLIKLVPRFVRAAQRLLNDEQVCLHAGERFHFCLAGAGGLAATHAPTPALALETFGRFVSSKDLIKVVSSRSEEEATFSVEVVASWPRPIREQVVDGFFSGLLAALRAVCGSSCVPIEVRLTRAEPEDSRVYARSLRGKVCFGSPRNELVIQASELTKRSLLCDSLLYEQLRFIADLSADRPSGTSPLRQLVEQAVRSGNFTAQSVAETLQVNQRTLQRRLQKEGVTFRTILNEGRVDLAKKLLVESHISITEVAQRLHYSDDKAFRKAFKTITGKTPSETRENRER